MQLDPNVINLLESRSSFPSGTCLHFSHVRPGKWDILSLTGHFSAAQLTTALHRCQLKSLLGHVADQNTWITSSTKNPSSLSSLPVPSVPCHQQHSPPARHSRFGEMAQGVSEGRDQLRTFLCKKFTQEDTSLNFCHYSLVKIWELEERGEGI